MSKKNDKFIESALMNNRTYIQYYNRLTELALSMFEWKGLPDTVDPRFLEMCLFADGKAVFFKDLYRKREGTDRPLHHEHDGQQFC